MNKEEEAYPEISFHDQKNLCRCLSRRHVSNDQAIANLAIDKTKIFITIWSQFEPRTTQQQHEIRYIYFYYIDTSVSTSIHLCNSGRCCEFPLHSLFVVHTYRESHFLQCVFVLPKG